MEDTVSRSSGDSLSAAGDEYEVVNAEPKLKIPGNGDIKDLEDKLSEVLAENPGPLPLKGLNMNLGEPKSSTQPPSIEDEKLATPKLDDETPANSSGDTNDLKATNDVDDKNTFFEDITYLGSASVNAPRSEKEIVRNMSVLHEQSKMVIPVSIVVPPTSEGSVRLLDPLSRTEIRSYPIHRILFCARGPINSNENCCFAFTCSHGDSAETTIFQCHVFRSNAPQEVSSILYSFMLAFRRYPVQQSSIEDGISLFHFQTSLEFKEDDGKGGFNACPSDKNMFKFRQHLEKQIIITVLQTSDRNELKILRCFGLLLCPGRNVKHSDMQLLDMKSLGKGSEGKSVTISGTWDPTDPTFQILNTETPKEMRVFMTLAVDLVIEGIQEPVRFVIETKAKIFPTNERFWYFTKKPQIEEFILKCKTSDKTSPVGTPTGAVQYEVISVESKAEVDRRSAGLALSLSPNKMPPQAVQTPQDPDEPESDGDEPLLSGTGFVSKDVTDEMLLESWSEVLIKWHSNLGQKPKQVNTLVKKGIPEALRGEVWQLLSGCHDNSEMTEAYRILIMKESPNEQVILRDINRTFPAHDFFKEAGGLGQDALLKISRAYSLYDEEVGYCQGLSFLSAALLLHMPEEQAFSVLVKIMFDYDVRSLFKQGFETLQLRFYQLERLMEDQISDLYNHFLELGLEAHMFASQWFLTLFTAKFPLVMVYRILDLFLCDGMNVIFAVALTLLKTSRKDLLALDFEGVLKYFRVNLPKRYRHDDNCTDFFQQYLYTKIRAKKLKKYETEYQLMKQNEIQQEDPIDRYERENKNLMETNIRLDRENDDLAHELVTSKIALRNNCDTLEDQCEYLTNELSITKNELTEAEEEKVRLATESEKLKEMCRTQSETAEAESSRNQAIIADYKQICSQLSERLEKQQTASKEELANIKTHIQPCDRCSKLLGLDTKSDEKGESLPTATASEAELHPVLVARDRQIRELELELAQTKLALVESECKTQDLTHQLNSALGEMQANKNNWLHKTISSIKEVTTKKDPKEKE